MRRSLAYLLLSLLPIAASAGSIYKWTDEQGKIHYSDQPIGNKNAKKIEVPAPPSKEEIECAKERHERMKQEAERLEKNRRDQSGSAQKFLGPLPPNTSSEFLTTTSTGVLYSFRSGRVISQYSISLKANPEIPAGAYLDAHFENPLDVSKPMVVGKRINVSERGIKEDIFQILSPEFEGIRCRNYEILVNVYSNDKKDNLLGRHRQFVQSRVDSSLISSPAQMIQDLAKKGHCCP